MNFSPRNIFSCELEFCKLLAKSTFVSVLEFSGVLGLFIVVIRLESFEKARWQAEGSD
jgi:hypothetical protein